MDASVGGILESCRIFSGNAHFLTFQDPSGILLGLFQDFGGDLRCGEAQAHLWPVAYSAGSIFH